MIVYHTQSIQKFSIETICGETVVYIPILKGSYRSSVYKGHNPAGLDTSYDRGEPRISSDRGRNHVNQSPVSHFGFLSSSPSREPHMITTITVMEYGIL